jgi:hypothetical protein
MSGANFPQGQTAEFVIKNPAGKALRTLAEELRGSTSEY